MIVSESKLKGITVVCLILAVISFISLISHFIIHYKIPTFADACHNCAAVEIVENNQSAGIYFAPPDMSVNQLLTSVGIKGKSLHPVLLKSGMKLIVNSELNNQDIVVTEMSNQTKLSIGLPIDLNQASEEDLLLIKGIGPATAEKIITLRGELKRFKNIKQLMEIKGIKEKKMKEIEKFLYVDTRQ